MHIVVCVKQIPNPEISAASLLLDDTGRRVTPAPSVKLVMSPFDEQAVEAALRMRDGGVGVKITAVTLGPESAREVLKHALAMGADQGVLLSDPTFEGGDGYTTALALARAIGKLGPCDLVLTGRQAADLDMGVVGPAIGELLGHPVVTFARKIEEVEGGVLRAERVIQDGVQTIEARLPAVVTISNELGTPRYPALREMMRAARKPITVWSCADLGLEPDEVGARGARTSAERFFRPEPPLGCELLRGETPREVAAGLVRRLRAANVIAAP